MPPEPISVQTHGHVQYIVHWRGYGKKYDSWVDESDTNERLKQVLRNSRLVAEKLDQYEETTNNQHRETRVCYHADGC